ncbi:MAG: hypothetical protein PVG66_09355 [Chromatiales bacterium]|jgi:hypothetical protein
MSTKDSAGDKLVASIRKTRSSAGVRSASKKTAVPKKPVATVKKKAAARKKTVAAGKQQKQQLVDLFQSGRRVWPD